MKEYNASDFIIKADTHYYNAVHLYKTYIDNLFPHHRYDPLQHIVSSCSLAGEIYVKAYMNENSIDYNFDHKLMQHLKKCIEHNKVFEIIKQDIELLINFTSDINYPSEIDVNKITVKKAINAVEHIIEFQEVKKLRNKYGIEDVVLYIKNDNT